MSLTFALLTPEERCKERAKLSKPVMDEFYTWLETLRVIPQSLMGKAIQYATTQRKYLERYLMDGRLEISNNRALSSALDNPHHSPKMSCCKAA